MDVSIRLPKRQANGLSCQLRQLVYSVLLFTLAICWLISPIHGTQLWLAFLFLTLPFFALLFQRFGQKQWQPYINQATPLIDAWLLGTIVILLNLPLLTSCLLMVMLISSHYYQNGSSNLAISALFLAMGCSVGYLVAHSYLPQQNFWLQLPALLGVSGFCLLLSQRSQQQSTTPTNLQALEYQHPLGQYVSPQIREQILAGKAATEPKSQRKKLTIFFSDISGFTDLLATLEPEESTQLLNSYFAAMSDTALKHGGTIDKFIGDGVMIFFGDPHSDGTKADAVAAVSMAMAMRQQLKKLRLTWREQGVYHPLDIRMGITTGYVTVGHFGTADYMDYTAIGREVNLASRLESKAEPNEILIAHETYALVNDIVSCKNRGEVRVKGFQQPIPVFRVIDFHHNLAQQQHRIEQDGMGYSVALDLKKIPTAERAALLKVLDTARRQLKEAVTGQATK